MNSWTTLFLQIQFTPITEDIKCKLNKEDKKENKLEIFKKVK